MCLRFDLIGALVLEEEFDLRSMFHMHHIVAGTWLLKHTLPWVQIKCVYLWVVVLVVLPKEVWPRGGTIGAL